METTVAALLLVTSTVVLACIAIGYAVDMVQQTFAGDSPSMQLMHTIQDRLLNETSMFNGTLPLSPGTPTP